MTVHSGGKMGPVLWTLYVFLRCTGIYFGDGERVVHFVQHPREALAKFRPSKRHLIHVLCLGIHLAFLVRSLLQLGHALRGSVVRTEDDASTMTALMQLHPSSKPLWNRTNLESFESSLKPITRIVFRVYIIMYYVDKVRFYLVCLWYGGQILHIFSDPLYAQIDKVKRHGWYLLVALLLYNLALLVIFDLYVLCGPVVTLSIDRFIQLFQVNNHYQMIFFLSFYILTVARVYLQRLTQWVRREETSLDDLVELKWLIHRLVCSLDRFYSLSSLWLLSKLLFSVCSVVFTFLYFFFHGHQEQTHRLLTFYLATIFTFDCFFYHLASSLTSAYDELYRALLDRVTGSMVTDCKVDRNYAWQRQQQQQQQPRVESIRIELFMFDAYRDRMVPRLYHLTTLHRSIQLRTVAFSVNIAIILFQTENY